MVQIPDLNKDIIAKRKAKVPPFDGERLVRMKELRWLTGLGRSTIYRLAANDKFPKPVRVLNFSAWKWSEVKTWIEARCDGKAV